MTPLEQIKSEYDKKFSKITVMWLSGLHSNPEAADGEVSEQTREQIWNFISQKILETEKRVARDSVERFAKYVDEAIAVDKPRNNMRNWAKQFINSLESKEK